MRTYLLDHKRFKVLIARFGNRYKCQKCDRPFRIGDTVVSRRTSVLTRWYHLECYEELHH